MQLQQLRIQTRRIQNILDLSAVCAFCTSVNRRSRLRDLDLSTAFVLSAYYHPIPPYDEHVKHDAH